MTSEVRRPGCWISLCLVLGLVVACAADRDGDGVKDTADRCPRTSPAETVSAEGCSELEEAIERGIDSLLAETAVRIGELWTAMKIDQLYPHDDLQGFIEHWKRTLANEPDALQIDPNAAPYPLPENPGHGIRLLRTFTLAPFGAPEERARQFVEDYVWRDESGYALTHQLLVLEWARESGLELPDVTWERRSALLERMATEQANHNGSFSDLFAERTALLLRHSDPTPEQASPWVARILEAQSAEGSWRDTRPSRWSFDGQTATAHHSKVHTTVWALYALAARHARATD